jgi:dTDP-glucose 4,6-dehydratase
MQNHDLVRLICRLMDELRPTDAPHERLIAFVEDRLGHDFRYAVDSVRIRQELGWRPSVSLLDGLRRTVAWYVRNEPWWRPLVASEDRGVGTESAQGTGDLPS